MKKRTIFLAAAVLVAGVAAALVWNLTRERSPGLSYEELLEMAGDKNAASSTVEEVVADPAVDVENTPEVPEPLPEEQPDSQETELPAAGDAETVVEQEAADGEAISETQAPTPEAETAAPAAPQETAAPSELESKPQEEPADSREFTAEELCDAKLAENIRQIEELQRRSERELYRVMQEAYSEYMDYPPEERNLMLKIRVVLSKTGDLTRAQSECDKEFDQIIAEMRQTLRENGRAETLADEAEKTYKQKKSELIKELKDQAYSGGDGSGQSGKWLAEHAEDFNS